MNHINAIEDAANAYAEAFGKYLARNGNWSSLLDADKALQAAIRAGVGSGEPVAWGVFREDGGAYIFQQKEAADCFGKSVPLYTAPQPATQAGEDTKRLNWLEDSQDGIYYNIDRIAAIKEIGFLTGPLTQQDKHETLREAIDAAIAAQGEKP